MAAPKPGDPNYVPYMRKAAPPVFQTGDGQEYNNQAPPIDPSTGVAAPPAGSPVGTQAPSLNHTAYNSTDSAFGLSAPPKQAAPEDHLAELKQQQDEYAAQFKAGLPGMENSLGNALKSNNNVNMVNNIRGVNNDSSRRGLLYGGLAAGREGQERARGQQALGQGLSSIHQGLINSSEQLDAQAAQTGLGIQQNQQAIQNQIYQSAMAQNNADNSMTGSMIGTIATVAMYAMMAP